MYTLNDKSIAYLDGINCNLYFPDYKSPTTILRKSAGQDAVILKLVKKYGNITYAVVHRPTGWVLSYNIAYNDAIQLRKNFTEFDFVIDVNKGIFSTMIGNHVHTLQCYLRFDMNGG